MERYLSFCVHRPRRFDSKASLEEAHTQRVPRLSTFVRKHDGKDAIVGEDPPRFREDRCHLRFVVKVRQFLLPLTHHREPGMVRNCLVVLIGQVIVEIVRHQPPERPFLPDVEVICEFRVHHVVVVRRVHADMSHGGVVQRETRCAALGDGDLSLKAFGLAQLGSTSLVQKTGNPAVGIFQLVETP